MTTGDFWGEPRIHGRPVSPCFPEGGMLRSILYGEAPGPRGADQSGVPFWGDGAGIPLYRALAVAGCADFADSVWERWDGAALRDALRLVMPTPAAPRTTASVSAPPSVVSLFHPKSLPVCVMSCAPPRREGQSGSLRLVDVLRKQLNRWWKSVGWGWSPCLIQAVRGC